MSYCALWLGTNDRTELGRAGQRERERIDVVPKIGLNILATLCRPKRPKRQFALSRHLLENKGTKKAILSDQSRQVTENKATYNNP